MTCLRDRIQDTVAKERKTIKGTRETEDIVNAATMQKLTILTKSKTHFLEWDENNRVAYSLCLLQSVPNEE